MSATISLILVYKYYILLPLAIFEGPLLAIISGFLISTGFLSLIPVYFIVVLGDALGDSFLYALGRWGRKTILNRFGKFFNVTPEKVKQAEEYFSSNQKKALVISKIIHGIGIGGLIAAGSLQISYWKFVKTCFVVSIIQSAVIITLGVLFGGAYIRLAEYLNYYSAGTIVMALAAILFFIFKKLKFHLKP